MAAAAWYSANYSTIAHWIVRPTDKVVLGEASSRTCRFCGKSEPEVTFKLEAHAIPEGLGNKSIFSNYECDPCNQAFGRGIENDLGNWSKPMRTFSRIRGKNSVPTLKKGGDPTNTERELRRARRGPRDRGRPDHRRRPPAQRRLSAARLQRRAPGPRVAGQRADRALSRQRRCAPSARAISTR